MQDNMLIGVIDSGLGGLEVVKRIYNSNERYILLLDKAFFPYGNKTKEFLLKRTVYLVDYLINMKVDKIILACNTLSVTCLNFLKTIYNIEIVGVFEPLVKYFKKGNLFIGTRQTVKYVRENYDVDCVSVEALINKIENNYDYQDLLDKYERYLFKYYDNVILGCTHLLKIPTDIISIGVLDQFKEKNKLSE